ncbi:MAG: 6-phosphogluconolactonase [Bacteroidia bacterium]
MSDSEILVFRDSLAVASAFASNLKKWTANEKPFHLALSGGSTPKLLFQYLASQPADFLPWDRIHLWWGDERMVSPDDPDSNFGMTETYLLNHINIPAENIHRILGEQSPEAAARIYQEEISQSVPMTDGWPVFDLILLGLGEDGHTASIFPYEIFLLRSPHICAVATHPDSGQKRITLTGRVINQAEKVAFLVTGAGKREKISQIFHGAPEAPIFPATYIQPEKGNLFWFLDYAAYGIA